LSHRPEAMLCVLVMLDVDHFNAGSTIVTVKQSGRRGAAEYCSRSHRAEVLRRDDLRDSLGA